MDDLCDVAYCGQPAVATMTWPASEDYPEGRSIQLCADDERYYRSIAGKHMTFARLPPKDWAELSERVAELPDKLRERLETPDE